MVRRSYRKIKPPGIVPPQPGLEPIIGNFYGSPPIDPTNCELYPDSLYCGGNPFTKSPIGIHFDIVQDECNFGVQGNAELAFIKLPPVQIVYRNPKCTLPINEEEIKPPKETIDNRFPANVPERIENGIYFFWLGYDYSYVDGYPFNNAGLGNNPSIAGRLWEEEKIKIDLIDFKREEIGDKIADLKFKYTRYKVSRTEENGELVESVKIDTQSILTGTINYSDGLDSFTDMRSNIALNPNESGSVIFWWTFDYDYFVDFINRGNRKNWDYYFKETIDRIIPDSPYSLSILSPIRNYTIQVVDTIFDNFGGKYYRSQWDTVNIEQEYYFTSNGIVKKGNKLSPPLPPMTCNCCPSVRQNDELLRLILKRIGTPLDVNIRDKNENEQGYQPETVNQQTLFNAAKINTDRTEVANTLIGIDEYPIKAPRSIIEDYKTVFPETVESLFEFAFDNPDVELKSLTQFLNWQVEQESATMGQWYQAIVYNDKNDKQQVTYLTNVAQTLREIIILLGGLNRTDTINNELILKALNELIQIKATGIRTGYIVEDIQDYLDYPTNEKSATFPLSISLPEKGKSFEENENIDRFLKPSKAQVTYQDWTGKQSLHDIMLDLLQAASAIRAVMTESGEELINYAKIPDGVLPNQGDFEEWVNSQV